MFKWRDYEKNSALFLEGVNTNVAILKHDGFILTDNTTGKKFKIKSLCIDEAKTNSQNTLLQYWKNTRDEFNKYLA